MTHTTSPLDMAKIIELKTMGIKSHVPYYDSTETILHHYQTPNNYPNFSPITLEQAENAPYRVNNPFSTKLKINEVGDNYQFKIRWSYKRKPQYILLNNQQQACLKELENGSHFFILDDDLQLQPITIENAITLPNYIKVTKEMGKIVAIEKKPLLSISKWEYEYWPHSAKLHYLRYFNYAIDKKTILQSSNVEYNEEGQSLISVTKNQNNKTISIKKYYPKGNEYLFETTLFNEQGDKTEIFYTPSVGDSKIVHLDKEGNIIEVTYGSFPSHKIANFEEEERYKNLEIDTSKKYIVVK
ncbi:hypothetical protein DKK76_02880 [Frischella perrara]|uniref:Uncharacterized protein n=1 Tax=Frischella perrara TaxID=1267021 RepID=A0A318MS69_FRIPE|nr:hypothetical protein [Frischella perrara]PXY95852.1 hypothetical protein DKK76_02880 [Frischella perrara]